MRLIDLSFPIENNQGEPISINVEKTSYDEGAKKICKEAKEILNISNPKFNENAFPDGLFISNEILTLGSHTGTHIDAPSHFGPFCNNKPSKTIDECPLEWFYGNAVVLDLKHKEGGETISSNDIKSAVSKIGYKINEGDIVLINTGTYHKWGTKEYFTCAPGMSVEATTFLIEQGVKLIGIDTYGFDLPFALMINKFINSENSAHLWPNHMLGRQVEYLHIERLNNLDALEKPFGFKFCGFPIKLKGIDASWIRAVAIYDE